MDSVKRAIVFLAWGDEFVSEIRDCIQGSRLPDYPKVLITDVATKVDLDDVQVVRADFALRGKTRKAEMVDHLPPEYESFLFLDSDTRVIDDISLGFEKAESHGIAAALAPHYSLDHFWGFGDILEREGLGRRGQLQYNTGVLFFSNAEPVMDVFRLWRDVTTRCQSDPFSDQPFFTLALEQLGFSPYTLSPSYNYRGFGELISGPVRIWHSHDEMPADINANMDVWPLRRVEDQVVVYPEAPGGGGESHARRFLKKMLPS